MYTPDLVKLIERHGHSPYLFADDTQVYGRCLPKGMSDLAALISACSVDILSWMRSNRLQLNADKSNLGVYIDSDLSMQSHVQQTVAGCFAALRQIRSVRRSLPSTALETLVVSLVLTRLDYGNATLVGIPANLLRRLQAVLTITGLPRSTHITTSLAGLH